MDDLTLDFKLASTGACNCNFCGYSNQLPKWNLVCKIGPINIARYGIVICKRCLEKVGRARQWRQPRRIKVKRNKDVSIV